LRFQKTEWPQSPLLASGELDAKRHFDQITDRCHADSSKWGRYDEDVLPLWLADMDFVSPEPVIRALLHGRYIVDFDAFEATITGRTRVSILCNPHNPVGRVFQRGELERMAGICLRHDIVICSDEIHCDLLFSGSRHLPIASLDPEIAERTITLLAPSKTCIN
jgi:bifunctional pyridoxal-dependent enzyme with beta-cystathionase and maltose regulon repressor activities